jgi:RNA polymerase sigma-70 factor, ECF subfamily
MDDENKRVTQPLSRTNSEGARSTEDLVQLLYAELRRLAASYLRRERAGHTLQPTALIHEAYLRLANDNEIHWDSRSHFLAIAASVMRRVLIDYARRHHAQKRGGAAPRLTLEEVIASSQEYPADLLALEELLTRLAGLDSQQAKVVELRVFGGLSVDEAAEVMGISRATVKRDWSMAKSWLARELSRNENP